MSKANLIEWLLPIILLFGWMVGGCSQKRQNTPARVDVTLQQMQFTPVEIDVHAGDTVVFINKGIVVQDVTEEAGKAGKAGKAWSSGPILVGKSFELVIEKDLRYYCSLHPIMKGKITIVQQ